jgi:hypothetical protein
VEKGKEMNRTYLILTVLVTLVLVVIASKLPERMRVTKPDVVKTVDLTYSVPAIYSVPVYSIYGPSRHPMRFHKLSSGIWQTFDGESLPPETVKLLSTVFDDDFKFDAPEQYSFEKDKR